MAKYNILKAALCVSVGNYSRWFKLSDYENKTEFIEACKDYFADEDEPNPDFFYLDAENIPFFTYENNITPDFWEILRVAKEIEDEKELDGFNAWLETEDRVSDFMRIESDIYSQFSGSWQGEHESLEHFYIDYLEDTGYFNEIPNENLKNEIIRYFDFDGYARDAEINRYAYIIGKHVFLKFRK